METLTDTVKRPAHVIPETFSERKAPKNLSSLRALLLRESNKRTKTPKIIEIDSSLVNGRRSIKDVSWALDVIGSETDIPVFIRVNSGMVIIRPISGKVVVYSNSAWGNVVVATGTSEVDVISGHDAKVSVDATENSSVIVKVKGEKHRGFKYATGNSTLRVINEITGLEIFEM